jgi:hypothetical protein
MPSTSIHRAESGGGSRHGQRVERTEARHPAVWPPAAMAARLSAEEALDALPHRAWGISAEARRTLSSIIAGVDHHLLAPEVAAELLRDLTGRLVLHRHAEDAIRDRERP